MMTYILPIIFIIIAAVADAFRDVNFNQFNNSIFNDANKYNPLFWNPLLSWRNKWKNPDAPVRERKPKFFGATTFLVFVTDGWHLFKTIFMTFMFLTILFFTPFITIFGLHGILILIIQFFGMYILYGIVFELTSNVIIKK